MLVMEGFGCRKVLARGKRKRGTWVIPKGTEGFSGAGYGRISKKLRKRLLAAGGIAAAAAGVYYGGGAIAAKLAAKKTVASPLTMKGVKSPVSSWTRGIQPPKASMFSKMGRFFKKHPSLTETGVKIGVSALQQKMAPKEEALPEEALPEEALPERALPERAPAVEALPKEAPKLPVVPMLVAGAVGAYFMFK